MKKLILVLIVSMLTSCGNDGVQDVLTIQSNSLPQGYTLMRIDVGRGISTDFVYVLCKNGEPITGASTTINRGKYDEHISSAVISKEEYVKMRNKLK